MGAMGLKFCAGKTFHLPTRLEEKRHLWIVVTDPDGIPEKVVIVNLTTLRHNSDMTVTLDRGDHRFIKHQTVVNYASARFVEVIKLQEAIKVGLSTFDEDCSDILLEQVQFGILESPFTPNNIKKYCRECFCDF